MPERYLGGGVYASWDNGTLILRTKEDDLIELDPDILRALLQYYSEGVNK